MAYIQGKKVLLTFLKDGTYTPFLCATDCSITINTEIVETRTVGDGFWAKPAGQSKSYSLSLTGLIELQTLQPVTFWLIENFDMQMLPVPFRMIFEDPATSLLKHITGQALITTSIANGVPVGFATSSFEMQGVGAPVITDSATICNATIGLIEAGYDPDSSSVIINYQDVVNASRLEYSVDGGSREVIFDPGENGFFNIFGLSDGPHTITVWAVCESGVDGESNELSFEVSGGEPVSCAAPGVPVISDITTAEAVATWAPASPVPGSGYYYEYGVVSTGDILDFGTTSGTSTGIFFLSPGGEYFFRVKSVCTAGVSESAFQSVTFNAATACNVPGTPSMSAITGTTATASWTAPSPAPADGYGWEVLEGITVVDSGTTAGLSVGLTGLTAGTSYTFRVKALCDEGVNESGYNSVNFDTTGESQIFWNFNEDLGNGTMVIRKNGVIVVNTTTAGAGNFTAAEDNIIQVTLTATTGNITVTDDTTSTEIINADGSGTFNESFTVELAHDYTINVTVTS